MKTKEWLNEYKKQFTKTENVERFGKRKFVLIPPPSFAHANWKNGVEEKIIKIFE